MATFNQKDIQLLFIGAQATKTTGGISTLNDGEIGIFTPAGARLTESSAATATEFIIVQCIAGATNVISNTIKKADIKYAVRKYYTAPTEQVDYFGFNGVSAGAIDVLNDNTYFLRINLRQGLTSNHGGLYLKHGVFKSDATATQAEIAAGLHNSLVANFSREPDRTIQFERVINSALSSLAETYSPVYKSRFVLASAAPTCSVGDAIRFGTTVADGTYIVTAIDSVNNIVTLDVPFQGTTATAVTTQNGSTAADWGVRLTGLLLPFVTGKLHFSMVGWELTTQDTGVTPITHTSASSTGSGYVRAVKELEFFCQGNEGDFYRVGEPNIYPRRELAVVNYDLIDIVVEKEYNGSIITNPIKKVYTIAIPETAPNYAVTATADDITDVLEVLVYGATTGTLDAV